MESQPQEKNNKILKDDSEFSSDDLESKALKI